MTDIDILLHAIETLRPELRDLIGAGWLEFEKQLNAYLEELKKTPASAPLLHVQILELFDPYPQAGERLAALIEDEPANRGVVRRDEVASQTPISPYTGPRYLNAGFFTAGRDDEPVASEQPLALAAAPYRLGVNVGEFWGLGTPDTPIPDDVLKPLFDQQPELTLDVVLRSFTVALPAPYQRLALAASGNSQMLFFPVEFAEVGRHTIEIDLIYCGHLLQSKRVEAYIVEQSGDPVPQSAWPVQDAYITFTRTAALDPTSLQALADRPSQLTIVIERSQTYNQVGLRFYHTSTGVEDLGFVPSEITDTNLPNLLKSAREQLQGTMQAYAGNIGGPDQQLAVQLGQLADIGSSFYCALLPGLSGVDRAKVASQKLLARLKPGAIIQVAPLSAQLSVPWELLYERPFLSYDPERTRLCSTWRTHGPEWADCPEHDNPEVVCPHGFWGYRYIIEQLPCRVERSDPPKPALSMYIRNGLPLKLVALINPDLKNWKTHWQTLTHLAAATSLVVDEHDTRDAIFVALKQPADILYIYAHGGQDKLGRPCWKVANEKSIVQQDLNALRITFESTQPLIVMNACESASYSPDDFESFLLYFCKHGAAGVIGAQCGVTELLVDGMMTRFMAAFLKQTSVGEALYLARRSLLFGEQPDPRGLVYSLFAAADLKLAQAVNI